MNGAIAEPWVRIINPPIRAMTRIMGSNQYFLRTRMNKMNSLIKEITAS